MKGYMTSKISKLNATGLKKLPFKSLPFQIGQLITDAKSEFKI